MFGLPSSVKLLQRKKMNSFEIPSFLLSYSFQYFSRSILSICKFPTNVQEYAERTSICIDSRSHTEERITRKVLK